MRKAREKIKQQTTQSQTHTHTRHDLWTPPPLIYSLQLPRPAMAAEHHAQPQQRLQPNQAIFLLSVGPKCLQARTAGMQQTLSQPLSQRALDRGRGATCAPSPPQKKRLSRETLDQHKTSAETSWHQLQSQTVTGTKHWPARAVRESSGASRTPAGARFSCDAMRRRVDGNSRPYA